MRTPDAARPVLSSRRRDLLLLALLFLVSLPAVTRRIYASDEVQYYAYLRSLWFDHDLSFENEYQHFYDAGIVRTAGFHETFLERTTEAGRRINFGTIGCALVWAPFFAVGDLTAHVLRAAGRPVETDGYSWPYISAVAYGSAFYGWLSLVLAAECLRRLRTPEGAAPLQRWSLAASLAVWLGTPLVFYMYVAPPMSHAVSACAVAALLLAWLVVRERWSARGAVVVAVLAALTAMVREQDAFVAAGPALDFVVCVIVTRDAAERSRLLRVAALAVLAGAVAFLPQALSYIALNGHLGPTHLVARKMTWTAPHALQVLLSPSHGFFIWTPLALAALAGLALLPRVVPHTARIAAALAVVVALQIYVAGSVESWTVAGAFGQRRFVALTPVLVIGLATIWTALHGWQRRLWAIAVAVMVWWNLALVAQFGAGMMDRQRLEPGRLAYNAFIVIPRRLPDLAYRYLFDRASFYEQRRQLSNGDR